METLSEDQKQNNPYTKNGDFSKQGEKNLYTQIIEILEQESKEKIEENLKNGVPYVIRQKMPKTGETLVEDVIYGKIKR